MTIRYTRFASQRDALSTKQIESFAATKAINVKTWDGSLRAMREPVAVASCKSFVTESASDDCSDIAAPPSVVCRAECSINVSGCGYSDVLHVENMQLLHSDGTKVGSARPTVGPEITITSSSATKDLISFAYSSINVWGEESRRSPPTMAKAGFGDRIDLVGSVPSGSTMRVYAQVTSALDSAKPLDGKGNTSWVVVGDFDNGIAGFTSDLTKWYVSSDGYEPDDWCEIDKVCCIAHSEDNHFAIFHGKTLWISERGLPYAYPMENMVELNHKILKVIPYYQAFFALTDGPPYLIRYPQRQDASIEVTPIAYSDTLPYLGGGSKSSFGAVYASYQGLVALTPSVPDGVRLLTRNIVNEDTWQTTYIPTHGVWCNGVYYGSGKTPFRFDLPDNNFGQYELNGFSQTSMKADFWHCGIDGAPYFSQDGKSYKAYGGDFAEAYWESKTEVQAGVRIFTAMKVVGDNLEGVTVSVWTRGKGWYFSRVLKSTDDNKPFRLPAVRGMEYRVSFKIPKSDKETKIDEIHLVPHINDLTETRATNG